MLRDTTRTDASSQRSKSRFRSTLYKRYGQSPEPLLEVFHEPEQILKMGQLALARRA